MRAGQIGLLMVALAALGCSSEDASEPDEKSGPPTPVCTSNTDCAATPDTPICDVEADACVAPPPGSAIGWGDGSPGSVGFAQVYAPEQPLEATDLAFHPGRTNELWVLRRFYEVPGDCLQGNSFTPACRAMDGSVAVVFDPGAATGGAQTYVDPNAWHFMRRPPAFAFGDNGTFASVGEHRTGNFTDDTFDYIGPTLWSSALPGVVPGCEGTPTGCFSVQPTGKNGSHLDMLHLSPYAMGIAHEQGNVYWVFNGDIGSIDRYDFNIDHGPGNDDHSDGDITRYVIGALTRVPNVPSHMAYDASDGSLYVADTGGQRVVKLDTNSGTPGGSINPNYDGISNREIDGASLTDLVAPGVLTAPSGLELHDGVLYVTDHTTSRIHAFDLQGNELRTLDTGFAPGSLAGITIGPDGKAYFVDMPNANVFRIDPL